MIIKPTTRSDCHKHITKREHYTRKNGQWKPKKQFETEEDANNWIKKYKMNKYKAYLCNICGKWHIGKNENN